MIGYARFILGSTSSVRRALQATPLTISSSNNTSQVIVANITDSAVTLDTVSGYMIIVKDGMIE